MELRKWRRREDITQVELARTLGITQGTLSQIEKGKVDIRMKFAAKIVAHTGGEVTFEALAGIEVK